MKLIQEHGLWSICIQGLRSEGEFEEGSVVIRMQNCDRNKKKS